MTAKAVALVAFAGAVSFARGAAAADATEPDHGILADESLLEPPPVQITQEVLLGLAVKPSDAWCGPTCPEDSLRMLYVGPRSTVSLSRGVSVSLVAGSVLVYRGSVGPEAFTMLEVAKEIGPAGILKLGIGYAPRIDFDG
jgi:hypothetical protein